MIMDTLASSLQLPLGIDRLVVRSQSLADRMWIPALIMS